MAPCLQIFVVGVLNHCCAIPFHAKSMLNAFVVSLVPACLLQCCHSVLVHFWQHCDNPLGAKVNIHVPISDLVPMIQKLLSPKSSDKLTNYKFCTSGTKFATSPEVPNHCTISQLPKVAALKPLYSLLLLFLQHTSPSKQLIRNSEQTSRSQHSQTTTSTLGKA